MNMPDQTLHCAVARVRARLALSAGRRAILGVALLGAMLATMATGCFSDVQEAEPMADGTDGTGGFFGDTDDDGRARPVDDLGPGRPPGGGSGGGTGEPSAPPMPTDDPTGTTATDPPDESETSGAATDDTEPTAETETDDTETGYDMCEGLGPFDWDLRNGKLTCRTDDDDKRGCCCLFVCANGIASNCEGMSCADWSAGT